MRLMIVGFTVVIVLGGGVARADFAFDTPTNLGPTINNSYDVMGVCVSHDGLELYFSSNQAGGYGGYDLMVSKRESSEHNWTIPVNLGEPLNTRYDAWEPSISTDCLTLYFSDPHYPPFGNLLPGGLGGQGDIWMAMRATTDDPWGAPVNLGPAINSLHAIFPCISADDLSLYFTSHRSGSSGQCDIMMATRKTSSENFGSPTFLSHINSNGNDWAPEVSTDGLKLFFMSNMDNPSSTSLNSLQLWMASRMSVSEPFKAPVKLPPHINMAGYGAFWPSLSPDCSALYFVSDRPGGFGGYDLWQVPITPIVDFNGDGVVDLDDMVILIENWGTSESLCDIAPPPFGDGIVDKGDLEVLMKYWGQEVDDPTLIAHWKLDETEGAMANDSAGSIQAELYGGPVWKPTDGMVDGALMLDGIDDFVGTWNIPGLSAGQLSLFAWIKGGAASQVVVSQYRGVNWLMADASGGYLKTDLKEAGETAQSLVSDVTITDGNWHRVGITWDGANRVLYVDDAAVASDTQANLGRSDIGLNIGCGPDETSGTFFRGLIDDVRIYNRAITP